MTAAIPPTPQAHDRLQFLLGEGNTQWNGIDFVEIASADQTQLRVHFRTPVTVAPSPPAGPLDVTISGGEPIRSVAVNPIDPATAWSADADGRPLLGIGVAAPGDFSTYTLKITGAPALDPYFDSAAFSFKANCPSDFDCAVAPPSGPAGPKEPVAINYLAKDYAAFTQALSDFSALRYPHWVERSEADVGVVLMEALSAIADELSYYQDRVGAEATLATATQRVSLVRHARLVDYDPAGPTAATTTLQLEVSGTGSLTTGDLRCSALGADGSRIPFEAGIGTDSDASTAYAVNPAWNVTDATGHAKLVPYWWDDTRQILPAGATTIWLLRDGHQLAAAQQLVLDTAGLTSADAPTRELITIAGVSEIVDPVFTDPSTNLPQAITRLDLAAPTVLEHDLTRTRLAGNLVPATHGEWTTETFAIPDGQAPPPTTLAVVRLAANWTPQDPRPSYLHTLAANQIAWLSAATTGPNAGTAATATPQIVLSSATATGTQIWMWQRWLLDAGPQDAAFTLTPERYSPVGSANGQTWFEYDGEGTTIRFGDGTFGVVPEPGTVFTATYLAGGGSVGNVPADTIVNVETPHPLVTACTNPFAAGGGDDAETTQQIKDRAPQAFSAAPLRIVRANDYVGAAQSLPWVQQAGTTFRWTGSWLTAFTTANPKSAEEPTLAELQELSDLLDRRRLAGYESYALTPQYTSLDLQITAVADCASYAADVNAAVLAALQPGPTAARKVGFFDHSRWRFGQPLDAGALLAAIQAASGVVGVSSVQYRRRGLDIDFAPLPETVTIAPERILRLDNDPNRPEAGSLQISVERGK